jgi:hypothetical protein
MLMKFVVFWAITRRRVVIIYRRFGTKYRSHPHGSRFLVGKKACNKETGHLFFCFSLVFVRLQFYSFPFSSFHFPSSCCCIPDIFLPLFSPCPALDHTMTLYPPLSHPIGCHHITHFPTPLCCPVSLLQDFFPTRNLDP